MLKVKLWRIPSVLDKNITDCDCVFNGFDKRVENVVWHPCSDAILAVTSERTIKIFDISSSEAKYGNKTLLIYRYRRHVYYSSISIQKKNISVNVKHLTLHFSDVEA